MFLRCYSLWQLLFSFSLGALAMFTFWIILARIAMSGIVTPGKGESGSRDNGGNGRI